MVEKWREMLTLFDDYLERLETLYHDLETAILDLSTEALDWVPGPDMNSLTVLVVHMTGTTRFWVGDMCLGDDSKRDRSAEFRAAGYTELQLTSIIKENLAYVREALTKIDLSDLGRERYSPRHNRTFPIAWSLFHALEHAALHVGHAQITRQLLDYHTGRTDE
jgi:hypothetical protein